ncbi:MAG: hypothetical protein RJA70_4559 [Pseudomonadota bacterium]|jgi:hypothetical protein
MPELSSAPIAPLEFDTPVPSGLRHLLTSNYAGEERSGTRLRVTYHPSDSSVFFDSEYVTRSVPGRILWCLLNETSAHGRKDFTNRELRHEPTLKLPPVRDNLETRLLLLRNRLDDKFPFVRLFRTGRGRFRIELDRDLDLRTNP